MKRLATVTAFVVWFGVFGLASDAKAMVTISRPDVMTSLPTAAEPDSAVQMSVKAFADTQPVTNIRWFVDGVEMTNDAQKTSITVPTGAIGEQIPVTAEVTLADGFTETASAAITPVRVDVLVGANSYVPDFFRGRALPGGSSAISVRALVFGGGTGPFTYEWSLGGWPQRDLAKNSNVFEFALDFAADEVVELQVYDRTGQLIATKNVVIEVHDPEIHFYEANPLQGLIPNTLKSPYYFLNPEVTLRGAPYYFSGEVHDYKVTWYIDDKPAGVGEAPLELSLMKTLEEGSSKIELDIINTDGHAETADAELTITY